ncbi:MAG: polyketide synthase dehydratase domain-containing protein [Desulfobacterales bacterium]|nr:polyketide synthase dehydratase domain-containing protein [Desulfobacterales bacterium]
MGNLSEIKPLSSMSQKIALPAYLQDHAFEGRALYPAVASMQQLAAAAAGQNISGRIMGQAAFAKFLEIAKGQDEIDAILELASADDQSLTGRLLTRQTMAASGITRTREHARLCFFPDHKAETIPDVLPAEGGEPVFRVRAEDVYHELVPFGPSYHNISGVLELEGGGVTAQIRAPQLPEPGGPLGSVFVLDAAFHAACVWTQRYRGFVGFPVGFDFRAVIRPAAAGFGYTARAVAGSGSGSGAGGSQDFDVWIVAADGRVCEYVRGLHMRDVFAGRRKPPAWICAGKQKPGGKI